MGWRHYSRMAKKRNPAHEKCRLVWRGKPLHSWVRGNNGVLYRMPATMDHLCKEPDKRHGSGTESERDSGINSDEAERLGHRDRKSTRLNSSHMSISHA